MMWNKMCKALEATQKLSSQKTITLLSRTYSDSRDLYFLKLLNRRGHAREASVRKLIPKTFNIFEEEVEKSYKNYLDYGNVVYYLDVGAESQEDYPLKTIYNVLTQGEDIKPFLLNMSALERKWLVRFYTNSKYTVRKDLLQTVLSNCFDIDRNLVLEHCNYSSLDDVIDSYHNGKHPSSSIRIGSFVTPMSSSKSPDTFDTDDYISRINYNLPVLQLHVKNEESHVLFSRSGNVISEGIEDLEINLPEGIYEIHKSEHNLLILDCLLFRSELLINLSILERLNKIQELESYVVEYDFSPDIFANYNLAIGAGHNGVLLYDKQGNYSVAEKSKNKLSYNPSNLEVLAVVTSANSDKFNSFKSFGVSIKEGDDFLEIGNFSKVPTKEDKLKLDNALRKQVIDFGRGKYTFRPRVVVSLRISGLSYKNNQPLMKGVRFISIATDRYANDCSSLEELEA